jgi:hypothetical protein
METLYSKWWIMSTPFERERQRGGYAAVRGIGYESQIEPRFAAGEPVRFDTFGTDLESSE